MAVNADGIVVEVGDRAEDLWSTELEDIKGRHISQLLDLQDGAGGVFALGLRPAPLRCTSANSNFSGFSQHTPRGKTNPRALRRQLAGPNDGAAVLKKLSALWDLVHTRAADRDEDPPVPAGEVAQLRARLRVLKGSSGTFRDAGAVAVEKLARSTPERLELHVWAVDQLEGVIAISQRGIIISATIGVQIIFGFRRSELIGQNVSVLMPPEIAQMHDAHLDAATSSTSRKKMVGVRRVVEAKHRDGKPIRIAIEVTESDPKLIKGSAWIARLVTTNDELSLLAGQKRLARQCAPRLLFPPLSFYLSVSKRVCPAAATRHCGCAASLLPCCSPSAVVFE